MKHDVWINTEHAKINNYLLWVCLLKYNNHMIRWKPGRYSNQSIRSDPNHIISNASWKVVHQKKNVVI